MEELNNKYAPKYCISNVPNKDRLVFKGDDVLTSRHRRLSNIPPEFKGQLMSHQETILAALLDFEESRKVNVEFTFNKTIGSFTSNYCFLSAPVGSGKTIVILAALTMRPQPQKIYEVKTYFIEDSIRRFNTDCSPRLTLYRKYDIILRPSVILLMPSVFIQWKNEIQKFTNFNLLEIANVNDLRRFEQLMFSGEINDYDIVIVKNNYITTNKGFAINNINPDPVQEKSMLSMLDKVLAAANASFSWAVYDDYDSSSPPNDAKLLPALFTVFVSSTTGSKKKGGNYSCGDLSNTKFGPYISTSFNSIEASAMHTELFKIRCSEKYIESCVDIPAPIYYKYRIRRNDSWALNAIGQLGAESILEMLNSDALKSAAERLGAAVAYSPTDILKTLLDKNYEDYRNSIIGSNRLKKWREFYINNFENQKLAKSCSDQLADSVIKSIVKNKKVNRDIVTWWCPYLIQKIDVAISDFAASHARLKSVLTRFNANMTDKECPICCSNLSEVESVAVTKCCSLPICSACIKNSGKFVIDTAKNGISGTCPQCRSIIEFPKGVAILSLSAVADASSFDEDEAVEDEDFIDDKVEDKVEDVKVNTDIPTDSPFLKKIKWVWSIAASQPIKATDELTIENVPTAKIKEIWNLFTSDKVVDPGKKSNYFKRILIFSNWPECWKYIIEYGAAAGISDKFILLKLSGGPKQLSSTLERFNTAEKDVLLFIESTKHCAGMNIQSATDVIFMHKIGDERIAAQVIGRTTRIGRSFSARIHSLVYDNET